VASAVAEVDRGRSYLVVGGTCVERLAAILDVVEQRRVEEEVVWSRRTISLAVLVVVALARLVLHVVDEGEVL
jgi:hypothetical protein